MAKMASITVWHRHGGSDDSVWSGYASQQRWRRLRGGASQQRCSLGLAVIQPQWLDLSPPGRCFLFFFSFAGKVARGGRCVAAFGRGWNGQQQGVVANMCEGKLVLCFANIHFLCIFLRSLMCQNVCG